MINIKHKIELEDGIKMINAWYLKIKGLDD